MIKNTNPNLVFSIGPGGNIENNMNLMFADVAKWSKEGWVDVIIPQLYLDVYKRQPLLHAIAQMGHLNCIRRE